MCVITNCHVIHLLSRQFGSQLIHSFLQTWIYSEASLLIECFLACEINLSCFIPFFYYFLVIDQCTGHKQAVQFSKLISVLDPLWKQLGRKKYSVLSLWWFICYAQSLSQLRDATECAEASCRITSTDVVYLYLDLSDFQGKKLSHPKHIIQNT